MIPKTIHYFWFGPKKKNRVIRKCIASWKKLNPDFEIIEWNESNFDVNMNSYTQRCYREKKYAFLSDYARLWVVYKHGGVYLDTDVELIKPIDSLLNRHAFFAFENDNYVASGLGFGSEANSDVLKRMLKEYDFLQNDSESLIGCPILNTHALETMGLEKNGQFQVLDNVEIYPKDWFNPYDMTREELNLTDNTLGIHWYAGSWLPWHKKLRRMFGKQIHILKRKWSDRQ